MGLRHYATGAWPYFGPDVVWTKSEIPGALQALLVGVPLQIVPLPEAPFVLLNLLSMAALAAFAWYITRAPSARCRSWLVWGWLMTLPWTLEFSTHIINPSYVPRARARVLHRLLRGGPGFRLRKLPPSGGVWLMGRGVSWVLQIHMSWPLLLPYAALAWLLALARRRARRRPSNVGALRRAAC